MNELKPCPFCGCEASFITREEFLSHEIHLFIKCTNCPAEVKAMWGDDIYNDLKHKEGIKFLIKAWNNRVEKSDNNFFKDEIIFLRSLIKDR